MKKIILIFAAAGVAVLLAGCQNPDGTRNNTGSAALIGGAVGAVAGAIIGEHNQHAGGGAAIGAAAGMILGGLIGNSMDQEQQARLRAQAPQTYKRVQQGNPLSIADVKALAKAGINEDVIVNQIKTSRTVFHLSAPDIIDLRDSGVSDAVINCMISTPTTAGAAAQTVVIQQAPPPVPVETVLISPGPSYMWVGGEWYWGGSGWHWSSGHWAMPPHPHAVWVAGHTWHDHRGWYSIRGSWRF